MSRINAQRAAFSQLMQAYDSQPKTAPMVDNALLSDYNLYPYLERAELNRRLKQEPGDATDTAIKAFLAREEGKPVAYGLRRHWIRVSAKENRWDTVDQQVRKSMPVKYQCLAIQAQKNLNVSATLVADILAIWNSGQSRPKQCDPLFEFLKRGKHIDEEEIRSRWKLAVLANNYSLAKYLSRDLSKEEQDWSQRIFLAQRQPKKGLEAELKLASPDPKILALAVHKLAAQDSDEAVAWFEKLEAADHIEDEQLETLRRRVTLGLAWDRKPNAIDWFDTLDADVINDKVLEWRARAAIWANDWKRLRKWINDLPEEMNESTEWQYWYARALIGLGKTTDGKRLMQTVADDTAYHAYLASDWLAQPYSLKQETVVKDAETQKALMVDENIQRARELVYARLFRKARNEWRRGLAGKDQKTLQQAAVLAQSWQWHSEALIALAKGQYWKDMELRYPFPHEQAVAKAANKLRIDPHWIWGIMRTESLFATDARSRVGARGLMQLMPGTAKLVSKKHALPYSGVDALTNAETNIALGSHYLKDLLMRYQGHLAIASAAYNAGPRRVDNWLPEKERRAEEWVANIPINETRRYVQRVLKHMAAFEWRANKPVVRLTDRLQPLSQRQILAAVK